MNMEWWKKPFSQVPEIQEGHSNLPKETPHRLFKITGPMHQKDTEWRSIPHFRGRVRRKAGSPTWNRYIEEIMALRPWGPEALRPWTQVKMTCDMWQKRNDWGKALMGELTTWKQIPAQSTEATQKGNLENNFSGLPNRRSKQRLPEGQSCVCMMNDQEKRESWIWRQSQPSMQALLKYSNTQRTDEHIYGAVVRKSPNSSEKNQWTMHSQEWGWSGHGAPESLAWYWENVNHWLNVKSPPPSNKNWPEAEQQGTCCFKVAYTCPPQSTGIQGF